MTRHADLILASLEPWDDVWRRNQHLVRQLVDQGFVTNVIFVEPPRLGLHRRALRQDPSVSVVTAPLVFPRRWGGLRVTRALLQVLLPSADLLWINDPVLGRSLLRRAAAACYDVTDDWRESALTPGARSALVSAEDHLATRVTTVVCSEALAARWRDRYGIAAAVVHNGVDLAAMRNASPVALPGPPPHVGYVGTLHSERLDVDLVLDVAASPRIGTVHLVGPNYLDPGTAALLAGHPKVRLPGAVSATAVPGLMKAMDVLLCPHKITPFTTSLDAIKAYEYAASGRPAVATATSGFERHHHPNVAVVPASTFRAATEAALNRVATVTADPDVDWAARAREFAAAVGLTPPGQPRPGSAPT